MIAGTPIFDEQSEEAFGVILSECDLDHLLTRQISKQMPYEEVAIVSKKAILFHQLGGRLDESSRGASVSVIEQFDEAMAWLSGHTEYIDKTDANIYGVSLRLGVQGQAIAYLLRQR